MQTRNGVAVFGFFDHFIQLTLKFRGRNLIYRCFVLVAAYILLTAYTLLAANASLAANTLLVAGT